MSSTAVPLRPGPSVPALALAAVLVLTSELAAPAPSVAEGKQTGTLAGSVTDSEGAVLPGVRVVAEGPLGRRTTVTGDDGSFRLGPLEVGLYRVSADLLGLGAERRDVGVYIGQITRVELRLEEAPPATAAGTEEVEGSTGEREWIEVVAQAPVIDRFETRLGGEISRDFLERLPIERFYQSVTLLLPGVEGGEDGNPNVSGALRSQNLYLVDGVDTSDPTTGLFGLNLAFPAVEAVDVATAAAGAEYGRASGAVINVVTGSGGGEYRGSVRWLGTNNAWNGDYRERGGLGPVVAAANAGPDRLNSTLAASMGGPLAAERLWLFAAYEDTESAFLRPTSFGELWDAGATVESSALKLTWRPAPAATVVAQHVRDSATSTAFAPFDRGPAENRGNLLPNPLGNPIVLPLPGDIFALEGRSQEGDFTRLAATWAAGRASSLRLGVAVQDRVLERRPRNSRGVTAGAPHIGIASLPVENSEIVLFNGLTDQGREERPREQVNLAAESFRTFGTVDHELRAGVDFQTTDSRRSFNFAGREGIDAATGFPVSGQLFLDLDPSLECQLNGVCVPFDPVTGAFRPFSFFNFWSRPDAGSTARSLALYAADTVTWGRWLVSAGLRWESFSGEDLANRELADDTGLAPRLAVVYDPGGEGEVLLSATAGRYLEPFLQGYLDAFGRLDPFSGLTQYTWAAFGGVDCTGQDPANLSSPCWFPTEFTAPAPVQAAAPNPGLARSRVDELTLGYERQLSPRTALSLQWVERRWRDLWDNVLGAVFDAEGRPILTSEIATVNEAERRYQALQLLVQRRYGRGWQLLGSYTYSRDEGNLFTEDGLDSFADFRQFSDVNLANRFGPAPYDREHRLRLAVNVQVPFERWNLSLGSVVKLDSGTPFQREQEEDLGVRFLTPRGSERLEEVFQWDLSALAQVRLTGELGLELKAEVFNLTDAQAQLGAETRVESGRFGRPRSILDLQAPRSYRVSAGLRF